jgi:hypothetical protein
VEWSFRLLMVFATVGAILALDHYLLQEALTGAIADAVGALR